MTIFDTTQHPRIDDGTFTDKVQTGPEISLSADSSSVELPHDETASKARDYAEQIRDHNPRVSREGAADLLAEVERTVRNMRRKNGLTEDQTKDAIGDTMLDLIARIDRGHSVRGGLVQIASNAVCSRYVNGPVRHETAKALKLLKERVAKEESRVGHNLNSADVARIAHDVRMGDDFKPRHRPVENFHMVEDFIRPTSFSQFPDSYIDEQMHAFGYGTGSSFDDMGSATDRLAEEIEMKQISAAEAKKRLWEVIAQDQGLPLATRDRLTPEVSENVDLYMSANSRVLKACRDHEDGISNKDTEGLFAPFAGITPRQSDSIVTMLLARPARATDLWRSALGAATAPKTKRRVKQPVA